MHRMGTLIPERVAFEKVIREDNSVAESKCSVCESRGSILNSSNSRYINILFTQLDSYIYIYSSCAALHIMCRRLKLQSPALDSRTGQDLFTAQDSKQPLPAKADNTGQDRATM